MNYSKKKWFLIFLYLVLSFIVITSLGFLLIDSVIEICISIYVGRPFYFNNIDVIQSIKIGLGGGGAGGIGCWYIYYRNYK